MGSDRGAEPAARRAIEPQRRRYGETEQNGLRGLFGDRERWVDTLKPFLWMQCNTTVQGFSGRRRTSRCPAGTTSLTLLFSETVFTWGITGFGVEQIPWACEARYQLPVQVWRR
jgi:hypothetical protein